MSIALMRIFMRFALRFAAFCLAFSTKMACVLHQNAVRFAAYCTIFCCKQPKSWCKLQFYAMYIHFACINNYPLLAPKQTFAGIDFLRSNGRLVDCKGTHNVKIHAENKTKWGTLVSEEVGVLVGLCVGYLVSLCVSRFISLRQFSGYIHVLPRITWCVFQILSYLCQELCT